MSKILAGEVGETVLRTLGTASRVFHFLGIAAGVLTLPIDICTLVSTSLEVHKGSITAVVKDIRDLAQQLED